MLRLPGLSLKLTFSYFQLHHQLNVSACISGHLPPRKSGYISYFPVATSELLKRWRRTGLEGTKLGRGGIPYLQAGLAGARGQAVCSASQAPIFEPFSAQEGRNLHNARWTFGFSIARRLGRDCRRRSEKDTERVRLKGLLTNSAGLQRILRQVLLKDHETRPVKSRSVSEETEQL